MPFNFFQNLQPQISDASSLAQPVQQPSLQLLDSEDLQTQVEQRLNASFQKSQSIQRDRLDPQLSLRPGANPYGVRRDPWVFATFDAVTSQDLLSLSASTENSTDEGSRPGVVIWYANPKSVEWSISQRGTQSKTKSGTTLSVWRDRTRKTDYDDPKITFNFQSGNIMPVSGEESQLGLTTANRIAPGLNDFYKFLELVDQSKIAKNGAANVVQILYRSRIFPSMILTGFFDPEAVVRFSDSADNPYQVNSWSANFTVYSTTPRLNSWSELHEMFMAEFADGDPFNQNPKAKSGDAASGLGDFQTNINTNRQA